MIFCAAKIVIFGTFPSSFVMDLLLLHGAIGASSQLLGLQEPLSGFGRVSSVEFSGHGLLSADSCDFSIERFAFDVVKYMDDHSIQTANFFGYSMGGYVGLYLAVHYPERVNKICTLATKLAWDTETAAREAKMLDPEKILQKVPHFADQLIARHSAENWQAVMTKTAAMMLEMGQHNPINTDHYRSIPHQVLLMLGDRDKMVTLDETVNVFTALTDARLAVLPATGHPIEQMPLQVISLILQQFLNG